MQTNRSLAYLGNPALQSLRCHHDARGHAYLVATPTPRTLQARDPETTGYRARHRAPLGWPLGRARTRFGAGSYHYTPSTPSDDKLAVLSLFSGIGGIDYGLEMTGHFYTVGFCEIEEFPRKVLRKHWGAEIPIFEDVRNVTAESIHRAGIKRVDVIAGGFPCQDISIAGNQAGIREGTRSGLWLEFARIIGDLRPRYVVLENVAAITRIDGTRVIADLTRMGYDTQWVTLFASDTGAPHVRKRWFCVGYLSDTLIKRFNGRWQRENGSEGNQKRITPIREYYSAKVEGFGQSQLEHTNRQRLQKCDAATIGSESGLAAGGYAEVDNSESNRNQRDGFAMAKPSIKAGQQNDGREFNCESGDSRGYGAGQPQSRLDRVFNGIPARLDGYWVAPPNEPQHAWEPPRVVSGKVNNRNHRIKALGNAVVPQVVAFVGECLWQFHQQQRPGGREEVR